VKLKPTDDEQIPEFLRPSQYFTLAARQGYSLCMVARRHIVSQSTSDDGTDKLWDAVNRQLHATLVGHKRSVNHCAWYPDGKVLASTSDDGFVKLWNATSFQLRSTLAGHKEWVNHCAWSPDGTVLASASP
jgi:WD40 repeat protein